MSLMSIRSGGSGTRPGDTAGHGTGWDRPGTGQGGTGGEGRGRKEGKENGGGERKRSYKHTEGLCLSAAAPEMGLPAPYQSAAASQPGPAPRENKILMSLPF